MDRASYSNSRAFFTLNPDVPSHWFYKKFLDNPNIQDKIDYWHFTLEDNATLSKDYIETTKARYPVGSAAYKRKILGLRAAGDNSIYQSYINQDTVFKIPDDTNYYKYCVSCDLGFSATTVLLLNGYRVNDDSTYILDEWVYVKGDDNKDLSPQDIINRINK
ncbi:MAG: phage terminase large subunit [Methanobrevibacter sp.]|nr:phage terminase large subunit [Methanobrevibacter sp.]